MAEKIMLEWNPGKVCFGLSRMGYSAPSAICDIVDNSVSNGASNCWIKINKKEEEYADTKPENIKEILIIDDGNGMSKEKMLEALNLGASDKDYIKGTLSKFGLGLKSASFSQGQRVEVVSSSGKGNFVKATIDLDLISDEYFCNIESLTDADKELIVEYCKDGHGTIVRIAKVRENNQATISNLRESLMSGGNKCTTNLGVVYYYYLLDGLNIFFQDEAVKPYDVIFEEEANGNGNLDARNWDGLTTKWVEKDKEIEVEPGTNIKMKISVVELPYPKLFNFEESVERTNVIKKYGIGAGNYGFYIYRNKRMIAWADKLDGLVSLNSSLYGFRGRILIQDDADEYFNIDVKKTRIEISGKLKQELQMKCDQYTRECVEAWEHASQLYKDKTKRKTEEITNEIVGDGNLKNDLTCEGINTPERAQQRTKNLEEIANSYKEKAIEETKKRLLNEGKNTDDVTEEEIRKTIKGNNESGRIHKIDFLPENVLFEPFYDATDGNSVRVNLNHGFADRVYRKNKEDVPLQVHIEMFLVALAEAEDRVMASTEANTNKTAMKKMFMEYRICLSDILGKICREKEDVIPPAKEDIYE